VKILGGIIWEALGELEAEERATRAESAEHSPSAPSEQVISEADDESQVGDRKTSKRSAVGVFTAATTAFWGLAKELSAYDPLFADAAIVTLLAFVCGTALTAVYALSRRTRLSAHDDE
jgi:hypothetical protein